MSINENQEFEVINQKTSERKAAEDTAAQGMQDACRKQIEKAKAMAIVKAIVTLIVLALALLGISALEWIGWINVTFRIVLMCLAGAAAMLKVGYYWREFKI